MRQGSVRKAILHVFLAGLLACLIFGLAACSDSSANDPANRDANRNDASAGKQEAAGSEDAGTEEIGEESGESGEREAIGLTGEQAEELEKMERMGPEDALLFERQISDGGVPEGAFERAAAQAEVLGERARQEAPSIAEKRWHLAGPTNIGGRVTDLAVHPNRPDTVYAATASGGVWKTTDAGRTFSQAWPAQNPQAIGAIAIAPDGTLYAGTGETNPGGGSITYGGDGLYRSTDGGASWKRMGLEDSSAIGRIVLDPNNPKRVYVAVSGDLFNPGGQRGLYLSEDRGAKFQQILAPPNDTTGAVDIAMDPEKPRRIFVSMWDHFREPDVRFYTGEGSGIWRTTNRGANWTRLGQANGLPGATDDIGRIGLAVDPQNTQRVYAVYANNKIGSFQNFFGSQDGGDNWTSLPGAATLADSQSVYGWWFGRVWVDPRNSQHIFVAGLPLMESTDGGTTFTENSPDFLHADQHAMAWDPKDAGRVYLGNDGGVYRSENDGTGGSWVFGEYQPWSQLVSVDVSEQKPGRISGGLQDNGSIRSWGGDDWNQYYGGDGQRNLINPEDKQNVFACYQYGACALSTDGGDTMEQYDQKTVSERHNYFNPVELQPGDPTTVYYAGNRVNRSPDGGQTWAPISPDLGEGDAGREVNPLYANHYGTVTTLGLSGKAPERVFAGTDNGRLWLTEDGGANWRKLRDEDLPERWITRVTVSPKDPQTAYATFSGYRGGEDEAYITRTRTGGESWKDISGDLPRAPVNDVLAIGGRVYVATDVGVFTTDDARTRWYRLGQDLPQAPVTDLRYVKQNGNLYAATFGRCIWSVNLR